MRVIETDSTWPSLTGARRQSFALQENPRQNQHASRGSSQERLVEDLDDDEDEKTTPKAWRSNFLFRSTGLHQISSLFKRRKPNKDVEQPKMAIAISRWMVGLLALGVHFIPVGISLTLILLNCIGFYIGGELNGPPGEDSIRFLALQFAAKISELFMLASLSMIVCSLIRHHLMCGVGIPFGALSLGLDPTKIAVLWSKEFWAVWQTRKRFVRRLVWVHFLLTVLFSISLGVSLGPAAATAIKPQLDDWPAGGTYLWLNTSDSTMFPSHLTGTPMVDPGCALVDIDVDGGCPSGSWQSFLDSFLSFWPYKSMDMQEQPMPETPRIPSQQSLRELSVRVRGSTFYSKDYTVATLPQAALANALVESSRLWPDAARDAHDQHQSNYFLRQDSKYNMTSIGPLAHVRCLAYNDEVPGFPVLDNPTSNFPIQTLQDNQTILSIQNSLTLDILNGMNSSNLQWLELPESTFGKQSIGAVIGISSSEFSELFVYGCTVDARWANVTLASSWSVGPKIVWGSPDGWIPDTTSYDKAWIGPGPEGPRYPRVKIDPSWAAYLNPQLMNEDGDVFSKIINGTGLWQSSVGSDIVNRLAAVESILAVMIVNGMSTIGSDAAIQGTLQSDLSGFMPSPPNRFGTGSTIYNVDPDDQKTLRQYRILVSATGYAFGLRGAGIYVSIVILCLYVLLVIIYLGFSLYYGVVSASWTTSLEIIALAMNSRPSSALHATAAGIYTSDPFKQFIRVVDRQGHLELAFPDHVDEKLEKPRMNSFYH